MLYVNFRSDGSISGPGFRAEYITVCGGTYTGHTGVIRSPFYPDAYPAGRDCEYRIVAPLAHVIRLEFQDFEVEGADGGSCRYDYVEIRDGGHANGTRLSKLCGVGLPDPVTSLYNEMYIAFHTDGSVQNRGED